MPFKFGGITIHDHDSWLDPIAGNMNEGIPINGSACSTHDAAHFTICKIVIWSHFEQFSSNMVLYPSYIKSRPKLNKSGNFQKKNK